jgi:CheY-like chemotaxis protein
MKGDSQKAIQAGCTKYMSKPINIVELAEAVDALVLKQTQRGTV